MISLQNYQATLSGRPVLHDITLAIRPGEFVAICGPNGAGKTTLLRALAGLLPGGTPQPRTQAFVEQGARCAWAMTVADVVALGRIPHADRNPAAIEAALAACNLAPLRDRRIDQISGGQARRAMLARALATDPAILLLDEPVADLDPAAAHRIMALLATLAATGKTVIAVLHALDLCTRYATRMLVLAEGRILADGTPAETLPAAAAAFGLPYGQDPAHRLLPPTSNQEPPWSASTESSPAAATPAKPPSATANASPRTTSVSTPTAPSTKPTPPSASLRLHTTADPSADAMLARIQNDLFDVGADLCVPGEAGVRLRITAAPTLRLDAETETLNAGLSPLSSFILPGGTPAAAHAHLARTIVRRAERLAVKLARDEPLNPELVRYLNRLSDHLFVLGRHLNRAGGDVLWEPGRGLKE